MLVNRTLRFFLASICVRATEWLGVSAQIVIFWNRKSLFPKIISLCAQNTPE
jgi:hypothetical protein